MNSRLQHFTILELMILDKALEVYQEKNEDAFNGNTDETMAGYDPFSNVSSSLKHEIHEEVERQTKWIDHSQEETPV